MNKIKEVRERQKNEAAMLSSAMELNGSKASKLNKNDSGFSEMTNSSINTVNSSKNAVSSDLINFAPIEASDENVRSSSESAVNMLDEYSKEAKKKE